jgi:hypothetical protein
VYPHPPAATVKLPLPVMVGFSARMPSPVFVIVVTGLMVGLVVKVSGKVNLVALS